MTDIFISYANEDRYRAIPIVKALEEQGWSTFWDWKSIPVAKTWRQFITEGIAKAKCVLVLWSEKSIDSEWVLEEADYGKSNKTLVPALIDDVRPPIGFGQIQAANLTNWTGDINNSEFNKLVEAIESLLGSSPKHVKEAESVAEKERRQKQEDEQRKDEEERKRKKAEIEVEYRRKEQGELPKAPAIHRSINKSVSVTANNKDGSETNPPFENKQRQPRKNKITRGIIFIIGFIILIIVFIKLQHNMSNLSQGEFSEIAPSSKKITEKKKYQGKQELNILNTPSSVTGTILGQLSPGESYLILEKKDYFYRIKTNRISSGWISTAFFNETNSSITEVRKQNDEITSSSERITKRMAYQGKQEANILNTPSSVTGTILGQLSPGESYLILEKKDYFYRIKTNKISSGWISITYFYWLK